MTIEAKSILLVLLLVISYKDFKKKIIPNELVILVFLVGIIYKLSIVMVSENSYEIYMDSLLGFLVGGGLFFFISIITNGGIGGGDIKLISAIGFWVGLDKMYITILYTFIIGAITTIGIKMLKKNKTNNETIAFGPFIAIGVFITMFV